MGGSKHVRLRVGVIGLGRLWETRHKPSLARLDDRFRVTAVYDPVFRRAELEATQIGCAACEGLAALVERPDVDVIYLLSRQWFGLHPIGLACAAGKPVYCCACRWPTTWPSLKSWRSWSNKAGSASCPSSPGDATRRPCVSRSCWRPSWARRVWSWDTPGFMDSTAMRSRARRPRSRRPHWRSIPAAT